MYSVNKNDSKCLWVIFVFLFIHDAIGKEKSMIETIIEQCALDKVANTSVLTDFRNQPHFLTCNNWTAISSINSKTEVEEKERVVYIRCLLYFETFISYCKHSSPASKNYSLIFKETIPENNFDVGAICEGLLTKPKIDGFNMYIWTVTQNKKLCERVCTEFKGDAIILNSMCAKSYYFNNLTLSMLTNVIQPNVKEENTQHDTTSANVETEKSAQHDIGGENIKKITFSEHNFSNTIKIEKNMNSNNKHPSEEVITTEVKNMEATENDRPSISYPDEQNKLNPNHDATNNEEDYNGESINNKQEESPIVTLPQAVEEKSRQEEIISNTFEVIKNDQFSQPYSYDGDMEGNSYFFTYFTFICVAFVIGYVGYHNKQKILALLLEGRQTRRSHRDIRPNSANYHKLDSTLEEAISSSCNKNSSYVIY